MPGVNFLTWCIDVLGSRYGWTRTECLQNLYWEEFWDHVITAANFTAEEQNAEYRFQFMLHADKKSASKWQDIPIPFPIKIKQKVQDKGGISQIPPHLQSLVYSPDNS